MEYEHRAYWAIKALNFRLPEAGAQRKLQHSKLEEIRNDAYENFKIYKAKVKDFHDKRILRKNFCVGDKVLLYNSRLHLFPRKLRSRWIGPYLVHKIYPHGAIDIIHPDSSNVIKVNGQRLKPFLENYPTDESVEELNDLVYVDPE